MSRNLKTRLQKSLDGSRIFLLSGLSEEERKTLSQKIQQLGAVYMDSESFHPNCTHVVCGKLSRSEKFLGGCATGKWVLHPDFITVSADKGKWQNEETYEWINYQATDFPIEMVMAARRWRFHVDAYQTNAFTGWKTAVIVRGAKKSAVYCKLLTFGGAEVYRLKLPLRNPGKIVNQLTFVFVSDHNAHLAMGLMDYGILCLRPEYIGDFLVKDPPPDPLDYLIRPSQNLIQDATVLDINISVLDSENDIMCSQVPVSASQNSSKTSKSIHSCTPRNILKLDPSVSGSSSSYSSPMRSSQLQTDKLSQESSHSITPSNVPKKRKILELELDSALREMKRQKVGHNKFVWRPNSFVGLSMAQVDEKHEEPRTFSSQLTGMIHSCFDEDNNDSAFLQAALDLLLSSITTKKLPQPQTIYLIMSKILQANHSPLLVDKGHHALMKILQIHPPISSFLVQLYMNSLKNNKCDGDSDRGQEEWKFVRNIIETVVNSGLDSEEPCSPATGHLLNLRFIVTMLEQNLKHTLKRVQENECSINKLRSTMVSQIMWTSLTHGSMNNRCKELMDLFGDCITCNLVPNAKMDVLNLILSLITMTTNVCYITECGGKSQWSHYIPSQSKTSAFIHQIAANINRHEVPYDVLKSILWALQPSILALNVCCDLLNYMDDYLVLGETPTDKISLQIIVSKYFYLIPKLDTQTSQTPFKSPHKKGLSQRSVSDSLVNKGKAKEKKINQESAQEVTRTLTTKMANKKNVKGETPLHVACIKNNILKVKQLLKVPGIDVNAKDNAGWTPLHEACNHGNVECVKELLNFVPAKTVEHYFSKGDQKCWKVDLLATDPELITPLHDAVLNDRIDVCKLLLQHGGSSLLQHRTILNNTPYDLATSDAMRELLSTYTDEVPSNKSFSQESILSEISMDGQGPSDYLYDQVFTHDHFVDLTECQKYVTKVFTILRSYLDMMDLRSLQNAISTSRENCHPSSLDVTKKTSLTSVQHNELSKRSSSPLQSNSVNINITSKEKNFVVPSNPVTSDHSHDPGFQEDLDSILSDIRTLRKLKSHVKRFESHIKRMCRPDDLQLLKSSIFSFYCLEENYATQIKDLFNR